MASSGSVRVRPSKRKRSVRKKRNRALKQTKERPARSIDVPSRGGGVVNHRNELGQGADGLEVLPGGEFLEWHKDKNSRSLIWSSRLPLPEVITRATEALGGSARAVRGYVAFDSQAPVEMSVDDAVAVATTRSSDVSFLRIEYPNQIAFIWVPKHRIAQASDAEFAEAGLLFEKSDTRGVVDTVRGIGTDKIGALATSIVAEVAA